jgi:hypothetical protein
MLPTLVKEATAYVDPTSKPATIFSYVSPEQRVRADHPLRAIRVMTDRVFAELSPRFTKMYSDIGRPSIPPEQLLRALVLQSPAPFQNRWSPCHLSWPSPPPRKGAT